YYSNRGKSYLKRFSIAFLAKAVMSVWLKVPHEATLTPSEIIDDKGYQQIFPRNNEISKEVYLACIRIAKPCDTIINSLKNRKSVKKINAFIATHFRFHIYSIAAALVTGKIDYDEDELAKISDDTVSKEMVLKIIE